MISEVLWQFRVHFFLISYFCFCVLFCVLCFFFFGDSHHLSPSLFFAIRSVEGPFTDIDFHFNFSRIYISVLLSPLFYVIFLQIGNRFLQHPNDFRYGELWIYLLRQGVKYKSIPSSSTSGRFHYPWDSIRWWPVASPFLGLGVESFVILLRMQFMLHLVLIAFPFIFL